MSSVSENSIPNNDSRNERSKNPLIELFRALSIDTGIFNTSKEEIKKAVADLSTYAIALRQVDRESGGGIHTGSQWPKGTPAPESLYFCAEDANNVAGGVQVSFAGGGTPYRVYEKLSEFIKDRQTFIVKYKTIESAPSTSGVENIHQSASFKYPFERSSPKYKLHDYQTVYFPTYNQAHSAMSGRAADLFHRKVFIAEQASPKEKDELVDMVMALYRSIKIVEDELGWKSINSMQGITVYFSAEHLSWTTTPSGGYALHVPNRTTESQLTKLIRAEVLRHKNESVR